MQEAFDAFVANKTWDSVECPTNRGIIGYKWVLKVKRNPGRDYSEVKVSIGCRGI